MEPRDDAFRAAVNRALIGRSVSRTAVAGGLPRDAIRHILRGHDPRLTRADDVCRALGITFTLGAAREAAPGKPAPSGGPSRLGRQPVRDVQLAELVSRLADQWETLPVRERAGLAVAVAAVLDLAGAKAGPSLLRTVEYLGWRTSE